VIVDWLLALRTVARPRVLDLGCGTAAIASELAAAGCDVVGVDLVPGMLRRARARMGRRPHGSVSLVRADLDGPLPYRSAAFDAGLCVASLHCVADPLRLLREIRRVLRPGAPLLLVVVRADGRVGPVRVWPRLFFNAVRAVPGWRGRVRTGTPDELAQLLVEAGLEVGERRVVSRSLVLAASAPASGRDGPSPMGPRPRGAWPGGAGDR
jgi:SAM-dependent methyltransferase